MCKRSVAVVLVWCLFVCSLSLFFTGCEKQPVKHEAHSFEWFDTPLSITGYESDPHRFTQAKEKAFAVFAQYHQLLDIYHTYKNTVNLATLNREAGKAPVAVSPELFDFLMFAKDMYALTEGKVNVAMGQVIALWHTASENAHRNIDPVLPDEAALRNAEKHCNINSLVLNETDRTVFFADSEMQLNAGALAKGYVAETVANLLKAEGFSHYALNLGGNIRVIDGKTKDDPWRVGVQEPRADEGYATVVSLNNLSLVTSGSYQRYFDYEGVRYHHIIDPATLFPAQSGICSVSVRTPDSGVADALSTCLFILSPAEGQALVASLPHTEAYWILDTGEILTSNGW